VKKSYLPPAAFLTLALFGINFGKGQLITYSAPVKEAPERLEQNSAVPRDLRYVLVDQAGWLLPKLEIDGWAMTPPMSFSYWNRSGSLTNRVDSRTGTRFVFAIKANRFVPKTPNAPRASPDPNLAAGTISQSRWRHIGTDPETSAGISLCAGSLPGVQVLQIACALILCVEKYTRRCSQIC
jgi:hypothetical protein